MPISCAHSTWLISTTRSRLSSAKGANWTRASLPPLLRRSPKRRPLQQTIRRTPRRHVLRCVVPSGLDWPAQIQTDCPAAQRRRASVLPAGNPCLPAPIWGIAKARAGLPHLAVPRGHWAPPCHASCQPAGQRCIYILLL
jgi:hypothetical protein